MYIFCVCMSEAFNSVYVMTAKFVCCSNRKRETQKRQEKWKRERETEKEKERRVDALFI